jgi:hypothetical protein
MLVYRTFRTAKRLRNLEIANACFCNLPFLVALTFLASACSYCFPVMIGLAVVIRSVATEHFAADAALKGVAVT